MGTTRKTDSRPKPPATPSRCKSEQAAAKLLGYMQTTWDNLSGKQKQPSSADKYWAQLTSREKAAAGVLGYIAKVWDNSSGKEKQPASASKYWAKLSACGKPGHGRKTVNSGKPTGKPGVGGKTSAKLSLTKRTWSADGSNTECDAGAGEVYRSQSSSLVKEIDACKKSCEDDSECKSITFFTSGWCSHFITDCTKRKFNGEAISMRSSRSNRFLRRS